MKQQILNWLSGPRTYLDGVELYKTYGHNKVLKNTLSRGETEYNLKTLIYELSQLVGITEADANNLKRVAFVPKAKTETLTINGTDPDDLDTLFLKLSAKLGIAVCEWQNSYSEIADEHKQMVEALAVKYNELPELQKSVINFRDKYPFLREPDCPNELKIMVTDMFAAYDKYRTEKALLTPENPDSENYEHAQAAVESYLENRLMWQELDHYKETGEVLGLHPLVAEIKLKADIALIADIDLPGKIKNAAINITKNKNAVAKAKEANNADNVAKHTEYLLKWEATHKLLVAELEARKK